MYIVVPSVIFYFFYIVFDIQIDIYLHRMCIFIPFGAIQAKLCLFPDPSSLLSSTKDAVKISATRFLPGNDTVVVDPVALFVLFFPSDQRSASSLDACLR